jgi:hypothetical protein
MAGEMKSGYGGDIVMEATMGAPGIGNAETKGSSGRLWASRVITGLVALFMLFDAAMKFVKPAPVAEAFVRSGWPLGLSVALGAILLTSTLLYLIPRPAILGALLLTGYLGGAVATNMRLETPLFSQTLFPVYFGMLLWLALWLREPRLRELIPLRGIRERV